MSQHTVGIVIDELLTDQDCGSGSLSIGWRRWPSSVSEASNRARTRSTCSAERMLVCGSGPAPRWALRSTGAHVVPSRRAPGMRTRSPYLVTAAEHHWS